MPPAPGWAVLATYASGLEADIAIARLESASIPAARESNDMVGIVGPHFQGRTSHGVTVLVPAGALDEARELLAPLDDGDAVDADLDVG